MKNIRLSGILEVVGLVLLAVAVFCALAMFAQPASRVMGFAIAALSNFISGLFFLAAAEVLRRLAEIVAELKRITGA